MDLASVGHGRDVVLTMGVFDGVHLGHRHLVSQVVRRARELHCLAAAITLHPHPRAVLGSGNGPSYIVSLSDRLGLLKATGLDVVSVLRFTQEVAGLSAREFMTLVCRHLNLRELWVGPDFCLGQGREGTSELLADIGLDLGFLVRAVPPLVVENQTISSTLIRELIHNGSVEDAARFLNRRHHVRGRMVSHHSVSRDLGIHVQTVLVEPPVACPASGTYGVTARVGEKLWQATAQPETYGSSIDGRLQVQASGLPEDLGGEAVQLMFTRQLDTQLSSVTGTVSQR